MNRPRLILFALGTLALAFAGCANVQPWEHGTLASYRMDRARDPLKTVIDEHAYFSREAGTGGQGVGGAGCGCN